MYAIRSYYGESFWCGGRNLAAEYFVGDPRLFVRRSPWIDLSFDLKGELVAQSLAQFELDWAFANDLSLPVRSVRTEVTGSVGAVPALAQLVDSGPDRADDTIFTLLVSACFTSQRRILAVTPYFVPEPSLLTALGRITSYNVCYTKLLRPTGFLERQRLSEAYEPAEARLKHYREFVATLNDEQSRVQGSRCMDCGIPFCNNACPVNNIIPDWNDLVYRGNWNRNNFV